MATELQTIPLLNLAIIFAPVAVVVVVLFRWSLNGLNALYSVGRMALQLALIGFLLTSVFSLDNPWLVTLVLGVMMTAASWIALDAVQPVRMKLYSRALAAIVLCGGSVLWLVVSVVLAESLFAPKVVIPLAGMIFAGAMNSISLAAERFQAELNRGQSDEVARNAAMQTAMIPVINSMFAVGLVSLPGMMTGQILSGVSPLIAVRYQVVVMCMLFGASGMATALFLKLALPLMSATNVIEPVNGE
ncbi:MAG: ABC transporter permease [Gammaproteobacteria bacterium]|nr:MAG: ABC transporter permease [Gammaproteobacteria bacterium]RLA11552.1 MAG: ABC transporter permease [Gammaproteobacteria bacterium]